jgi:hypothetical protein
MDRKHLGETTMTNLNTHTTRILTILGLVCMIALTLGCETGDPAFDGDWDMPLEEIEGELSFSATKVQTAEAVDTETDDSADEQSDYQTCLEACMDDGGTFTSCHNTCSNTFTVHYQSCLNNCMASGGTFTSCHRTCKPPTPKPVDKSDALESTTKAGMMADDSDSDTDGDTDEFLLTAEAEDTPYATCLNACIADGGTFTSCHSTCKELIKPVTKELLSGLKAALSRQ